MTKPEETRKRPSVKMSKDDDPIWNIVKNINDEFTGNNGWFCSGGLFYVCSQEGTKVYTKEEFEKIKDLFDKKDEA